MGHKFKGRGLAPLDSAILHFLWRWKLAPATVLYIALAKEISVRSFVKRLKKLERNEMIRAEKDPFDGHFTWELTQSGFFAIRESLGGIQDLGFRSASRVHDRLVQAFHLGEWIFEREKKPALITEQMLLRLERGLLPSWVPDPRSHRPDGYTWLEKVGKSELIAFEVELHAKSLSRNADVFRWYEIHRRIGRVLWLVDEPGTMAQLIAAKTEARDTSQNFHLFALVDEYMKHGWNTRLANERSERVLSIAEIMQGPAGLERRNHAGTSGAAHKVSIYSDRRKFLDIQRL